MDPIKEAFAKIKEEILLLRKEVDVLRVEILKIKQDETDINTSLNPALYSTKEQISVFKPTYKQTFPQEMKGLGFGLKDISTGNEGVPTNSQVSKQSDKKEGFLDQQTHVFEENGGINDLHNTIEALDDIKKEIRTLMKKLTNQEMAVFSTIYGLELQGVEEITYRIIASNLHLSESSIRDYVNKIIIKGVPIEKIKQNNKKVLLFIPKDLKRVASLSTLIRLREI